MPTTAWLGSEQVRRVGFGAMQLPGPGVFGPPRDPKAARAVLRRAIERGVDHIDTSQYYGPDVANQLIHDVLHPYPAELKLVTKVGARRDEGGRWLAWQRPEELVAGVEDNLRTLEVDHLHVVNLRRLDEVDHESSVPLAEQLGALQTLREQGKVKHIGISNVDRAAAEEALAITEIVCVQDAYSVLDRTSQPVLDLCRERDIAFVPFFPLGSAFMGGPAKLAAETTVARTAAKHAATPAQVALAWLLGLDHRILLIPGTSSIAHLDENLAAYDLTLDDEDMDALEAIPHQTATSG